MNVGSLFSGIGGLDAGLARAGFTHGFLCESDEWRRSVLAGRFPGVPIWDDVATVGSVTDVGGRRDDHGAMEGAGSGERALLTERHEVTAVDLLAGGFPCQDLSVAGRRAGLQAGERSSLFFEFMRVADDLVRPGGYVLIENVPGLLSSQGGRDFAIVLASLAELGFHDLAWRVLDSRYFGVPQRRRRVFVLGRRASGDCCAEVLLEPESGGRDSAAGGEAGARATTTSALGTTRGGGHGLNAEKAAGNQLIVADTLTSGSHPGSNMPGRRREDDTNIVVGIAENQRGELLGTPYSHQLTSGGGKPGQGYGAVRIAAAVRRLTPIECERLQGLPDDWTDPHGTAPDSRRYAGLGDAVTANVGEWVGRRLLAVEGSYVRAAA